MMQQAMAGLQNPEHLDDGLYVGYDEPLHGVWLKAERDGMIHEVFLTGSGFNLLCRYVQRTQAPSPADVQTPEEGYADANDND